MLPDGAVFCNLCGGDAMAYDPQQEYSEPPVPKPVKAAPPQTPIKQDVHTSEALKPKAKPKSAKAAKQSGGKGGIIAAVVAVILFVGGLGGHFIGLYSLPMLPGRAEISETSNANTTPRQSQGGTSVAPQTQEPTSTPDGNNTPGASGILKRYEYIDLKFTYSWGEFVNEPGVIGRVEYGFRIVGDLAGIADVLAVTGMSVEWSDTEIVDNIENVVAQWKQHGRAINHEFDPNGYVPGQSSIAPHSLGQTTWILFAVFNKSYEPIGHVIIPITFPADASGTSGNEQAIPETAEVPEEARPAIDEANRPAVAEMAPERPR
jgi:hypothetical protein